MCGFVGVWNLSGEAVTPGQIDSMSGLIAHRGPDDYAQFIDRDLGLGHRRLSIIDLTAAGRQPMPNEDQSLWVVYNGEIYNYLELTEELKGLGHVFRTHCDTEVILHAYRQWGAACVERFNGMWAFAIWDPHKRQLFCSRDRFGIKPFYYYLSDKCFAFASEIKALLVLPNVPRVMNAGSIYRYLVYHVKDDGADTCFQGIQQLPPGHNLTVDRHRAESTRYWNVDFHPDDHLDRRSADDLADEFRSLLTDSIRLRLRSDVPVGLTLSGGLDSSSIAALIAPIRADPLRTFSVNYPGSNHDESGFVDALLQQYPKLMATVDCPSGSDVADVMEQTVWYQDEPCWGPAVYSWWRVMQAVSKGDVTVVLNGQGADELLAGYPVYYPTYLRQLLKQGRVLRFAHEQKAWRSLCNLDFAGGIKWLASPIWPSFVRNRITSLSSVRSYDNSFLQADFQEHSSKGTRIDRKGFTSLAAHLQQDFSKTRLPELLHAEDRFSMAFSLESRVPFLDHRLVRFAARLPDIHKIHEGTTKTILRQAMRNQLPSMTCERRDKMGYPTPGIEWLCTTARDYVQDLLHSKAIREHGVFCASTLQKRFDLMCRGGSKSREFWRWLSTEVWMRQFLDSPSMSRSGKPQLASASAVSMQSV
jgi:asparagine synthase (glutamine-hydrolysing)